MLDTFSRRVVVATALCAHLSGPRRRARSRVRPRQSTTAGTSSWRRTSAGSGSSLTRDRTLLSATRG